MKLTPVSENISTKYSRKELKCLADNIYHESRGEPIEGQILVGVVTLNRSNTIGSICSAIYAKSQFSWVGKQNNILDKKAYIIAWDSGIKAMYRNEEVYYFHNRRIKPKWNVEKFLTVGNHVFYKR